MIDNLYHFLNKIILFFIKYTYTPILYSDNSTYLIIVKKYFLLYLERIIVDAAKGKDVEPPCPKAPIK